MDFMKDNYPKDLDYMSTYVEETDVLGRFQKICPETPYFATVLFYNQYYHTNTE